MSREKTIEKYRAARPAVFPALLLCDFANLEREVHALEEAGAAALHLDVMDGVFVPNLTYGMTVVAAVRQCTALPIDVHLMIVEPQNYIEPFRDAGADSITFHAEATGDPRVTLDRIRDRDAVAGVAINPATPVSTIEHCLEAADLVLIMSVNAGFGGQSFDETVLSKFEQVRKIAGENVLLQIDGGINAQTIGIASRHGMDLFVAGSAIFNSNDYKTALEDLNRELGVINENF